MESKFAGVHTALITPFKATGELDTKALIDLIVDQRQAGVSGIVLAGTTGEAPTLSLDERISLVRIAKEHAGHMAVIAGAGSNCTKSAIHLQKAMEDAGADATLQVVPYYNKPTQKGLFSHFLAIAEQARAPIMLYNASGRTGIEIDPKTVASIAKEAPLVIGIKDANTDISRLSCMIDLTKKANPSFLVLAGEDAALLPFSAMGAHGIISVASHIAAAELIAIHRGVVTGDLDSAQRISQKINGLCDLLFSHTNPIPIKTILADMGLVEKCFRLPLCPLSSQEEAELLAGVRDFNFLSAFSSRGYQR